jgi:hypothetical protein
MLVAATMCGPLQARSDVMGTALIFFTNLASVDADKVE